MVIDGLYIGIYTCINSRKKNTKYSPYKNKWYYWHHIMGLFFGLFALTCNSVVTGAKSNTQQHGTLLRIKKGTITFDASYKGYNYAKGKIVTVDCLNDSKALLYIQDPEHTGAAGWGSDYNCYYAILDLNTDKLEEIKYNGAVLPYSAGTFSQRSMVFGNKAYIGVNPKNSDPCIYIYDIKTGAVTKGLSITKGYLFDRIVTLKD